MEIISVKQSHPDVTLNTGSLRSFADYFLYFLTQPPNPQMYVQGEHVKTKDLF